MVPCSSAATPPPPPPPSRSAELQQLWANAYDGWSNVPGANAPAVYLCPSGDTAVASVSEPFPEAVLQSRVFALTAWNPMGEDAEPDANRRANLSLEAEVRTTRQRRVVIRAAVWPLRFECYSLCKHACVHSC